MKKDLVDILACPVCKGELVLTATKSEGEEVVSGKLRCDRCAHDYPIEDSIPCISQGSYAVSRHYTVPNQISTRTTL